MQPEWYSMMGIVLNVIQCCGGSCVVLRSGNVGWHYLHFVHGMKQRKSKTCSYIGNWGLKSSTSYPIHYIRIRCLRQRGIPHRKSCVDFVCLTKAPISVDGVLPLVDIVGPRIGTNVLVANRVRVVVGHTWANNLTSLFFPLTLSHVHSLNESKIVLINTEEI